MDNTYQNIVVQIQNLSRMINNLSNRLYHVENTTRNSYQTSYNNMNLLSTAEHELLNSLNSTNHNQFTRPVNRNNQPDLRRSHIRPESRYLNVDYINPLWGGSRTYINPESIPRPNVNTNTNVSTNTSNSTQIPTFSTRQNRNPSNETTRRRVLPTLHNPEIRRSYNSDGSVDSIEMIFTNLVSQEELNSMVQNAAHPTARPENLRATPRLYQQSATRREANSHSINSPEDARMFLTMLNALSTAQLNEHRRLTLHDINTHTHVTTYHQSEVVPENEESETAEDELCLICRASFEEGDILRQLNNCPHYFHCNCIDNWFELRNTCPVCRHVITEIREESIENNSNNNNSNETDNSLRTMDRLD